MEESTKGSSEGSAALNKIKILFPEIVSFLNGQVSSCGFPVYTSMDIRDAGWKTSVVDVNLFPAGFNNLTPSDRERGSQRMREFFSAKLLKPAPWRIVVVPEAHTHNMGYLENLSGILELLKNAGCETRLLWPGEPLPKAWKVTTPSGKELEYLPAQEALDNADALLLNHDLSGGVPKVIQGLSLPTFPSTKLGWYRRKKSTHQEIVESLLKRIQKNFSDFDPWYFTAATTRMTGVDFESESSLHAIGSLAQEKLEQIGNEYRTRGIKETPRLFVKNNSGTYGMGVFVIQNAEELLSANRKMKNKMKKGKESVPISEVILQEAVPTSFTYTSGSNVIAGEPVLYMVNGLPIGGFMRIHEGLGADARFENLNQPGSLLEPLDCARKERKYFRPFDLIRDTSPCQELGTFEVYGFLARLHAVAAGLEECPE